MSYRVVDRSSVDCTKRSVVCSRDCKRGVNCRCVDCRRVGKRGGGCRCFCWRVIGCSRGVLEKFISKPTGNTELIPELKTHTCINKDNQSLDYKQTIITTVTN